MKDNNAPRKIVVTTILFLALMLQAAPQEVAVDLTMAYKIRQEGLKNSDIDTIAWLMTDLAGPRLTGSSGIDRANGIARAQLAKYGLSDVRIEEAADFPNGSWEYSKAYAAMVVPYYVNFAVTPVAWTAGTSGLLKGEVILIDIKKPEDFEKYKGKLKGKVVMTPSANAYQVSYKPIAERYNEEALK